MAIVKIGNNEYRCLQSDIDIFGTPEEGAIYNCVDSGATYKGETYADVRNSNASDFPDNPVCFVLKSITKSKNERTVNPVCMSQDLTKFTGKHYRVIDFFRNLVYDLNPYSGVSGDLTWEGAKLINSNTSQFVGLDCNITPSNYNKIVFIGKDSSVEAGSGSPDFMTQNCSVFNSSTHNDEFKVTAYPNKTAYIAAFDYRFTRHYLSHIRNNIALYYNDIVVCTKSDEETPIYTSLYNLKYTDAKDIFGLDNYKFSRIIGKNTSAQVVGRTTRHDKKLVATNEPLYIALVEYVKVGSGGIRVRNVVPLDCLDAFVAEILD